MPRRKARAAVSANIWKIRQPASRTSAALPDCLVTLPYVDENRIGVLGICGGGGYAVNAAMTERRFKAVDTVVGAIYGRLCREDDLSPDAAIKALEGISAQRTAEVRGTEAAITTYIPQSKAQLESYGLTDVDVVEAVDYYTTQRGQKPGSPNKLNVVSTGAAFTWNAFHLAEKLLIQPLQTILGGGEAGRLRVVQQGPIREKEHPRRAGATHYDLYDKLDCVDQAVPKLKAFYGENL